MPPASLPSIDQSRPQPSDGTGGGGSSASTEAFDPSDEYRRLLEAAAPRGAGGGGGGPEGSSGGRRPEAYQYLMSRERRVLDTVDRVVNDSIVKEDAGRTLFGMPAHELAMRAIGAVRALFDDLVAARSIEDATHALADPDRRPYLGVAMVAIALLMAAINCL